MALTGTRRDAAALALARGLNLTTLAKETGVGRRTPHRRLADDPDFRRRADEARDPL
jgi:hypothetical protein